MKTATHPASAPARLPASSHTPAPYDGPTRDEVLAMAIADAAAPLRRSAHAIMELRGAPSRSPK